MLARLHHRLHWRGAGRDVPLDGWVSRVYDWAARWPLRGFYRRIAAETAAVAPAGGAVLDAGTGPGRLLVELADRRPDLRITGVDLSQDMVALARRNVGRSGHDGRIEVHEADVAALPFPDEAFDMVVSSLSMHHWGALPPAMAELARVLRPGGTLWIYDLRSLPDEPVVSAMGRAFGHRPPQRTTSRATHLPWSSCARWSITRPVDALRPAQRPRTGG